MEINENKSTIYTFGLEVFRTWVLEHVLFSALDMLEGIKYMGFTLKPNCYAKADWY
jgi:hypothetical protein